MRIDWLAGDVVGACVGEIEENVCSERIDGDEGHGFGQENPMGWRRTVNPVA